jgi:hypothetical protein
MFAQRLDKNRIRIFNRIEIFSEKSYSDLDLESNVRNSNCRDEITINVPLFKKVRDIIFFVGQ